MSGQHLEDLDKCRARGMWLEYYDPDAERFSLPTYPYHSAPAGLRTRRQLRQAGLALGGHQPVAQILWNHKGPARRQNGCRVAYLYDKSLAVPKRTATPAQLRAVGKALIARKTCPSCQQVQSYCIPKSLGECNFCANAARGITREPEIDDPWQWAPQPQPEREPEMELWLPDASAHAAV